MSNAAAVIEVLEHEIRLLEDQARMAQALSDGAVRVEDRDQQGQASVELQRKAELLRRAVDLIRRGVPLQ
jgi:hypothetical protein